MKAKQIASASIFLFFIFVASMNAQGKVPYSIRGDISNNFAASLQKIEFEGLFTNESQKEIESFTIVFFVLDQDGNSPLRGRNNIVIKISETVPPSSTFTFSQKLDDFFYTTEDSSFLEDDEEYECEYLYVSRIEYSDGSEWSDPFGSEYF